MRTRPLCILYAVLATAGAAATWYFNILFVLESGGTFDLAAFVQGGFANYAAGSLSVDVSIAAVTFLVWMLCEAGRLGMPHRWAYVLITLCVAFACAFPLFLLMRQLRLERLGLINIREHTVNKISVSFNG